MYVAFCCTFNAGEKMENYLEKMENCLEKMENYLANCCYLAFEVFLKNFSPGIVVAQQPIGTHCRKVSELLLLILQRSCKVDSVELKCITEQGLDGRTCDRHVWVQLVDQGGMTWILDPTVAQFFSDDKQTEDNQRTYSTVTSPPFQFERKGTNEYPVFVGLVTNLSGIVQVGSFTICF